MYDALMYTFQYQGFENCAVYALKLLEDRNSNELVKEENLKQ